jgi:hypothetical protein
MLHFFCLGYQLNYKTRERQLWKILKFKGKTKTIVLDMQKIYYCLTLFNHHYHIYYNFAESLKFQLKNK